jgi:hypothetical protein
MHLTSPNSAILSAVIFNALIIVVLIPLALKGVKYRALGAAALLAAQSIDLRRGRHHCAVRGNQADRYAAHRHTPGLVGKGYRMMLMIRPLVLLFVILTAVTGVAYPLLVTGIGKVAFPEQVAGSLVMRDHRPIGSSLIGQSFQDPKYFWGRLSATAPMAE